MNVDLAADPRVLENVHALNNQRFGQPEVRRQTFHLGRPRKTVEHGVEIMQRMSDFVERMKKIVPELTVFVKSILFEKERNPITGIQKIIIAGSFLLGGLEDRRMPVIVEIGGQFRRPFDQCVAFLPRIKPFDNQKTVVLKLFKPPAHNVAMITEILMTIEGQI